MNRTKQKLHPSELDALERIGGYDLARLTAVSQRAADLVRARMWLRQAIEHPYASKVDRRAYVMAARALFTLARSKDLVEV